MEETQVISGSDDKETKNETKETKKEVPDFDEKAVVDAMSARAEYFKERADSLTFEGVRRVIEKDLNLDPFSLDAHKSFLRQRLEEFFEAARRENVSKSSGESKDETVDLSGKDKPKQEPKELGDGKRTHGSPVTEKTSDVAISKDKMKEAIRKRAAYFKENSSTITFVGVRRLLERDLKLDKHALDSYKDFLREKLDEVLDNSSVVEPANEVKSKKRKNSGKNSECSESADEVEEEEVKPKKKISKKTQSSDDLKNRKGPAKESTKSSKKQKQSVESKSDGSDDATVGGDKEPAKKKSEAANQVYGKRVEHLKTVIRSCAMSVPPSVYKRAKQVPENEREACLIKELEEILRKEGLSSNPSEKEIKAVKKQKERTKELEGIDLSNIVPSSRRRSTSSSLPPPPKVSVGSDEEGDDDDDEDDEEDNDDEDDDIEDEINDGNEDESADEGAIEKNESESD